MKTTWEHSFLTFGPEFHMYTCMHALARLLASYHTVKVHDVTAKHCAPIDQRHAPESYGLFYSRTSPKVSTDCPKAQEWNFSRYASEYSDNIRPLLHVFGKIASLRWSYPTSNKSMASKSLFYSRATIDHVQGRQNDSQKRCFDKRSRCSLVK